MDDCLFCRIAQGRADADIIAESESAVAFRDIHPKAPVHVLVAPKGHYESLAAMGDKEGPLLGNLFSFVRAVAESLHIAQSGYKVVMNVGRGAGQLIDHLHIHILGGWGEKPKKIDV